MAYKTEEVKKMALDAIKKHNLFTVEDIVGFIPCSKETFYNHKLHESDDIKQAIWQVRVTTKQAMKNKWFNSDNATLQVALMKMIGNEDERKALTQQYIEEKQEVTHTYKDLDDEQLAAIIEARKN